MQSKNQQLNASIQLSDETIGIEIAYSKDIEQAEEFKILLQEAFPNKVISISPLSLSVSCHTGPGAIGVGVFKKLRK